jgi:DNA polymerase I
MDSNLKDSDHRLFLLDGMALAYRAHFALIRNPMVNSKGLNTSAIHGFLNTILELKRTYSPTHLLVVFDIGEPTERLKLFPEYKANRESMPDDLRLALSFLNPVLKALRIPTLGLAGWEADDLVGTIVKQAEKRGLISYMVTPDKDFAQLVSETTWILKPGRQKEPAQILKVQDVLEKWQIERVDQVIDILGLMGDAVDNIPGIPGIGEKTAQKLIAQYGSVEGLLKNASKLKGKQRENVEKFSDQALLSKQLATIQCDAPIEFLWDEWEIQEPDRESAAAMFQELEFTTLAKRILGSEVASFTSKAEPDPELGQQDFFNSLDKSETPQSATSAGAPMQTLEDWESDYLLVETEEERRALANLLAQQSSVCFDTETTGLDLQTSRILGVSFCFKKGQAFYAPLPEEKEHLHSALHDFDPFWTAQKVEKIGHFMKFDLGMLSWHGVEVSGPFFDTQAAQRLVAPDAKSSLDHMAEFYLNYRTITIESVAGVEPGSKNDIQMETVPLEALKDYAAEDAEVSFRLKEILEPKLKELGQDRVFREVEMPLIPALIAMEKAGVSVDEEELREISKELERESGNLEREIFEMAGETFNLNSPKQLGVVLFEKMKLVEKPKKTKTGQYSTNEDTLIKLAATHDIAAMIMRHRGLTKLKNTYVDPLPSFVSLRTGRIHTTFNPLIAVTGRMQSEKPNLQNIPIRTDDGRKVRRAFVTRDPKKFQILSADYSQIELRILADMSGDKGLREAFSQGLDIHQATAAKVHGVTLDSVTSEMRRVAKMVNFGIAYGISAFGLAQRLGISRPAAGEIIQEYFEQFPGVRAYMDQTIAFAGEYGYVETKLGRRRYLRDITSANSATRQAEERNAINSPIQGTAADMIKLAMIKIHDRLNQEGFQTVMALQIHDELVFEAPNAELESVQVLIRDCMQTAMPLAVPVEVEIGCGDNWLEAH